MRPFLWQSIFLGFAATSTAIYQGTIATPDSKAIGVVRVQSGSDENNFGSGVVLGNGKCVITAAHVVKGKNPRDLKVFKNKMEQNNITRTNISVTGSSIHINPKYTGTSEPEEGLSPYDFAVVELESTMDTSPWKVSLTRGDYQDVTLYGWGRISSSISLATYPVELRSAVNKNRDINYWDQCKSWRSFVGAICIMNQASTYPNNAPAEGLNCGGDSGGPAVTKEYVVGITSGNNGPCGLQTAGLLAGLSGSSQTEFMQEYKTKCGFEFGSP